MKKPASGWTRVLLKARPTPAQIADRLAPPRPDGLELYLDAQDLLDDHIDRVVEMARTVATSEDFTWIVEAPIRTIGGEYFDLTRDDADHRATLDRVIAVGARIGAVAANVHLVAPTRAPASLSLAARREAIERTFSLLDYYVRRCRDHGLVPQIENVPPVGRMREESFVFSPIGLGPADLLEVATPFGELFLTVDVSHAALYLQWRHTAVETVEPWLQPVALYCRTEPAPDDLPGFIQAVAHRILTVHVSNASGLLGEGLRYCEGDENLDSALAPLVGKVPYFVTETLERDPERALGMREAQRYLEDLVGRWQNRSR